MALHSAWPAGTPRIHWTFAPKTPEISRSEHEGDEVGPGKVLHDLGEEGLATVHTQSMQAKTRRTVAFPESFGCKLAVVEPA